LRQKGLPEGIADIEKSSIETSLADGRGPGLSEPQNGVARGSGTLAFGVERLDVKVIGLGRLAEQVPIGTAIFLVSGMFLGGHAFRALLGNESAE
jgi:hypothetical protein